MGNMGDGVDGDNSGAGDGWKGGRLRGACQDAWNEGS
jgi:hypothetical protein